ncbi:MAG: hypothetical protein KDJ25_16070, partial [Rhodoblastus sp.]|nr:hypothetical protein [Rhodoblastus sp.]
MADAAGVEALAVGGPADALLRLEEGTAMRRRRQDHLVIELMRPAPESPGTQSNPSVFRAFAGSWTGRFRHLSASASLWAMTTAAPALAQVDAP